MTLFELMGIISIENSGANAAIDETTDKARGLANTLEGSGNGGVAGAAQSMGSKVANAASKVGTTVVKAAATVGKTVLTGVAAGTAAVGALTKQSVSAYADYEQLVGGVDTLFKDASDAVQEYAADAYKTAGMSANEYMETVTGFSASLIQSLEGDVATAADVANQTIIDMSDNANKMGTDMGMIQNAYQGFAKQNYTMLDNLKLGYGGTKEEMSRLLEDAEKLSGVKYELGNFADITEAIHVIQTQLGITGTTANEASTTISGSWGSLKGAWQNLLVGFANEDADLGKLMGNVGDTAGNFASNLIPRIGEAIGGIKDAIPELAESLAPGLSEGLSSAFDLIGLDIPPDKITNFIGNAFDKVGDLGQSLGGAGGKIGTALKNAFTDIFNSMGEESISFEGFWDGLTKGIENAGDGVAGFVETLGGMISDNMPTFVNIGENLKGIAQPIFESLKTEFGEIDWSGAFSGMSAAVEGITGGISAFMNADDDSFLGKTRDLLGEIANLPLQTLENAAGNIEDIGAAFKVAQEISAGKIDFSAAFASIKTQLENDSKDISGAANSIRSQMEGLLDGVDIGTPSFASALAAAASAADQIIAMIQGGLDAVASYADHRPEVTDAGTGNTVKLGKAGATTSTLAADRNAAIANLANEYAGTGRASGMSNTKGVILNVDDPYGVMNLNADGAIFSKATIFGYANNKLQVAGEAGAEAVAPIDVLQGYVSEAVAAQNQGIFEMMAQTIETMREYTENVTAAIENSMQNVTIKVGKREFGRTVKEVGASV